MFWNSNIVLEIVLQLTAGFVIARVSTWLAYYMYASIPESRRIYRHRNPSMTVNLERIGGNVSAELFQQFIVLMVLFPLAMMLILGLSSVFTWEELYRFFVLIQGASLPYIATRLVLASRDARKYRYDGS